jgi:1-acyl-sn-glycerol-3-phosphate acyltransferase
VWSGIRLFFRRVVIKNAHLLPSDRPVVIVANHQNALLDPVVLCISTFRQLHWLTRADVFKSRPVAKFLNRINMMPVYRERDRVADIHDRNNEIFNQCYARMKRNACIGIFPEGTHRGKKQLVPLKKGLARLVLGAHDAGVENVCIVPAGLDYESFYEPQKNLIVKFGEPIEVAAIISQNAESPAKVHAEITRVVAQALKKLMIHIDQEDVHHEILSLKPLLDALHPIDSTMDKYERFHSISIELDHNPQYHAFLNHEVNRYRTSLHELRIEEELYSKRLTLLNWIFFVVGSPIALLAALVFWPLQMFTERFVRTVIQDTLFRNSIRISFWTFITPIYLMLVYGILRWSGAESPIIYAPLLALPAGLITLPWWRNSLLIMHWMRCMRMRNSTKFQDWLKQRTEVLNWLKKIPYIKNDV